MRNFRSVESYKSFVRSMEEDEMDMRSQIMGYLEHMGDWECRNWLGNYDSMNCLRGALA